MQHAVSLDDKYTLAEGRAFMTGVQVLVRLPMLQRDLDRKAGLNTAGFISGYRGSPLGTYDDALAKAKPFLAPQNIHVHPGLNEDLAATSIWGTQQVSLLPDRTVEGVFALWYGKGPGVDRSADVLKHANAAGTSALGGVLAIMGDDHGCQSSTLPHQSEQIMAAAMIPVLSPASIQECLDYGLVGIAMSRFSGCWVALKATTEIIEASAVVDIGLSRHTVTLPADVSPVAGALGIRWPDTPLDQESRLHGPKMQAVLAFARANRLDRVIAKSAGAVLGIVSTGKAFADTMEALALLDLPPGGSGASPVALYKVAMPWPLEPEGLRRFAQGLSSVLVVEEKRSLIEEQAARILYGTSDAPALSGRIDEDGQPLLRSAGELNPHLIASAIAGRLTKLLGPNPHLGARLKALAAAQEARATPARLIRTAFFCAGCPHNTSTNVPEGSRAMAGIGCHGMAYSIPERRTSFISQMGGEGTPWIGQSPFTSETHVFQNLGDGTYFHSGLLAIRAAAAAGVNITYKILFNDAVAMTGGQQHDGNLTVPAITRQVAAEGARAIVVVTDEPGRYASRSDLAEGTRVVDRDRLDDTQRELRACAGLSVIVYDQTCAAEKRRRRKRGTLPEPDHRLVINTLVCEGCGDCSTKSNCIAVKPIDTPFGRKRQIDQSDCNKDYSCQKGFCPSFVTVRGKRRRPEAVTTTASGVLQSLPLPKPRALTGPLNILITGIGGTGVVTVGALLGMAAHIEGKGATVLDFTGLAQKNGGVMSHVRLAPHQDTLHASRIGAGAVDVLLACDLMVAASPAGLALLSREKTSAVINACVTPPAAFVRDGTIDLSLAAETRTLRAMLGKRAVFVEASTLATTLLGDAIATNLFMLGFAWQRGLVPLAFASLDEAIRINGVAVAANRQAFAWGRLAAHDPTALQAALPKTPGGKPLAPHDLANLVEHRAHDLIAYQNTRYAERFRALVHVADAADIGIGKQDKSFARQVATSFYKLLAYKDEYEVARLFSDGRFAAELATAFEPGAKLKFNLAPPLFARRRAGTEELEKREFSAWLETVFRLLASLRWLRGSSLDPFGYQAERRRERALISEYEDTIRNLATRLSEETYDLSVAVAALPETYRGYGHVKKAAIERGRTSRADLLARLSHQHELPVAAE